MGCYPIGVLIYYRDQTKGGGFDRSHQWCVTIWEKAMVEGQPNDLYHGVLLVAVEVTLRFINAGACPVSKGRRVTTNKTEKEKLFVSLVNQKKKDKVLPLSRTGRVLSVQKRKK